MEIRSMSIDIETYSWTNLPKSGVYRYAEDPAFQILLFSYGIDGGPVQQVDLASGERIPEEIVEAIRSPEVIKWAFNASFERICLSRYLGLPTGEYLNPSFWRCSMVWCGTLGLPMSLEGAGAIIKLSNQKLKEGRDLIRRFCSPHTPTKANGNRTRFMPADDPEGWSLFKRYNIRDVEAEMEIQQRLSKFPVPDEIWDEYVQDQLINDRGVMIDRTLVRNAIRFDARSHERLMIRMQQATELQNPNSVKQMKDWLADHDIEVESLGKKEVKALILTAPEEIRDVLELRLQLAKSSIRKYQAMESSVCSDGRCRGMFQFYGANRTGRWAGRIVQMQNLPRNSIKDLDKARELVKAGDYDAFCVSFEDVPDTLSQLIRTAFISKQGTRFIVCDYSSVEARVIAYLAGEQWRLDAFAARKDIYCASAEQIFKVPVEKHGINGKLRQSGKIAELALGYGGGVSALKAMGALDPEYGLKEEDLQPLVDGWRFASPNIVKFWWDVDKVAKKAVSEKTTTSTHGIIFSYQSGFLFVTLPSGRRLAYVKPRIGENRFGGTSITYEGIDASKKWGRLETYGPKIVENIVQAFSRDLLALSLKRLKDCRICMHIHDEVVIEAPEGLELDYVSRMMSESPEWAADMELRADGYETEYYMKD